MPTLTVNHLPVADAWKDIVRVPHAHRIGINGKPIRRGEICKLTIANRHRYVVVHGCPQKGAAIIQIDSKVRNDLKVSVGNSYPFGLEIASTFGVWKWMWRASEPMYRVPAQLGLISLFLGVVGLVLGLLALHQEIGELIHKLI